MFGSQGGVSLTQKTENLVEKIAKTSFISLKSKKCRNLRKALGGSRTELFLRENPKLAKVCERLAKIKIAAGPCEETADVGLVEVLEFSSDVFGVIGIF